MVIAFSSYDNNGGGRRLRDESDRSELAIQRAPCQSSKNRSHRRSASPRHGQPKRVLAQGSYAAIAAQVNNKSSSNANGSRPIYLLHKKRFSSSKARGGGLAGTKQTDANESQKIPRELLLQNSPQKVLDNFSLAESNSLYSNGRESEQNSIVIAAPCRRKEDYEVFAEEYDDITLAADLQLDDREQDRPGGHDNANGDSKRQGLEEEFIRIERIETPRIVTATDITADKRTRSCIPIFRKSQPKKTTLHPMNDDKRVVAVHNMEKSIVIAPTSYFNEELEERTLSHHGHERLFLSRNTTTASITEDQCLPAPEKDPLLENYNDQSSQAQATSPSLEETAGPTMSEEKGCSPFWLDVTTSACGLGNMEECAHCKKMVYREFAHMRQYPYSEDMNSRFQYFHINCHNDRTRVEKQMASVRNEFHILNERFKKKKKKEKELCKTFKAKGVRTKKKAETTESKPGRKWNWLHRKERK